jgi:hypothetical protein
MAERGTQRHTMRMHSAATEEACDRTAVPSQLRESQDMALMNNAVFRRKSLELLKIMLEQEARRDEVALLSGPS